jgi:hypothetical protein
MEFSGTFYLESAEFCTVALHSIEFCSVARKLQLFIRLVRNSFRSTSLTTSLFVCTYLWIMDVFALSACLQACLPPFSLSSTYPSVCNLFECFSSYPSPLSTSTTRCLPACHLSFYPSAYFSLSACRPLSQSICLQPVFYLLTKLICLQATRLSPPPPPVCLPPQSLFASFLFLCR